MGATLRSNCTYNHANLRGERYAGNLANCVGDVKHIDTRVGIEREIDSFSVEKRVASGDKKGAP